MNNDITTLLVPSLCSTQDFAVEEESAQPIFYPELVGDLLIPEEGFLNLNLDALQIQF